MGTIVTGQAIQRIEQPREKVVQQFEDLEHHDAHHLHGMQWKVLEERARERLIRVGRKTARLFWEQDVLLLLVVAGAGKGTTMYHRFDAISPTETEVTMSFEMSLPFLLGWLAPLVRSVIGRDMRRGLLEDKLDLERDGYPRVADD